MPSDVRKVFISCDLEGITGVVGREQTRPAGGGYAQARKMMTADVNAAIEGAFAGGAGLAVVGDGHGSMHNLLLEELDPRAEVVIGSPKPLTQMEGIDGSFDVAMFIGYHARMGAPGVLSHTISGAKVANTWINDRLVGETGLNAALAGHFGVPVGLVTGDQCVCAEATELLGDVLTVAVKHAITRYSARCLHPQQSRRLIREAAERATGNPAAFAPFKVELPVTLKIQFKDTGMAEAAMGVPGVVRVDPTSLAYTGEDPVSAFQAVRAMIGLAPV